MKNTSFQPTVREDGTLDPDCLERAGQRWLKDWLRARLSGHDPFFPVDTRSDEDPESFVVGVLRDAGLAHPASGMMARSILQLLDEARSLAPEVPAWFPPLLRICQQVHLPQAGTWFAKELSEIAASPMDAEARWRGSGLVREILFAASLQVPGLPRSASRKSWLSLIDKPSYATLALLGFGPSFEARIVHLEVWWRSCPTNERTRELNQIIFQAIKSEGEERVREILEAAGGQWENGLQKAVDAALRRRGAAEVFKSPTVPVKRRGTHCGAIDGAGLRREFLLSDSDADAA